MIDTIKKIVFAALLVANAQAGAQDVTRIVVPFAPGGGTDQYVRLLAVELGKRGIQTIVENKPGASGVVAADYVARSRPDGRTLVMTSQGMLITNTVMHEKLRYDPLKDFAHISQIAYQPSIIVGRPDLPYKNIKEMVAYAKANPGSINCGSPGAAILTNVAPVAFEQMAGISTTHIPFNGDSPGIQALLGGQIEILGTSITGPLPHIKARKLIVLGVMGDKRIPQVPEAPTFREQGFDIDAVLWYALAAPAGTPKDVIERLNRAIKEISADADVIDRARAIGMEPKASSPEELMKYISSESDRWLPILRALNLPKM